MKAALLIAVSTNSQEMLLFLILLVLFGLGIASLVIFLLPRASPKPSGSEPVPPPENVPVTLSITVPDGLGDSEVEAFKRYADSAYAEAAARLECLFLKCHQCGGVARPIRGTHDRYKCAGCHRNLPGPPFQFNAKDFPSATLPDAFDRYLPPAALDDAVAWRARFAVEEKLLKQFKVDKQTFEDYWKAHVTARLDALLQ
jgi:hypothetical protein